MRSRERLGRVRTPGAEPAGAGPDRPLADLAGPRFRPGLGFQGEPVEHALEAMAVVFQALSVEELQALISEAGREPVERDTLYRRVRREGADWEIEQ